jgi:Tol biopolymer transport system component
MKRKFLELMKLISLTLMLAIVAPALIQAQAGKAYFAGNWVLNAEKSTQPQSGSGNQRMGGGNFTVAQETNLLTRTRTGQDGTTRITRYTLDGKESINSTARGESKSKVNWSDDGKMLTIVSHVIVDGNERTITETWSLIDAKTLSIVITRKNQEGAEVKSTMIYDKK